MSCPAAGCCARTPMGSWLPTRLPSSALTGRREPLSQKKLQRASWWANTEERAEAKNSRHLF